MTLPGLIVKKVGMTRMLDDDGKMVPVTLLVADKQKVTKILTPERDGYHGIQVGYYEKPEYRLRRPDVHRLRKVGVNENFSAFKEFRLEKVDEAIKIGSDLTVSSFAEVKVVDITGISKGRGFQGALRRWNSARGRMTHGSRFHRRPGSLGMRSTPGRVFKNKHMPGHMGVDVKTILNLKVMVVDKDQNVIALKGSVPGHRDGYLMVKPSNKG